MTTTTPEIKTALPLAKMPTYEGRLKAYMSAIHGMAHNYLDCSHDQAKRLAIAIQSDLSSIKCDAGEIDITIGAVKKDGFVTVTGSSEEELITRITPALSIAKLLMSIDKCRKLGMNWTGTRIALQDTLQEWMFPVAKE